jgi:hypothetical protein
MQVYDIYLDRSKVGGQLCVLAGTSSSLLSATLQMISGDKLRLRLHFRAVAGYGAISTSLTLDSGDVVVLAGKLASNPGASNALFVCDSFALVAGTDNYYEGVLDLNTTELTTALTSATFVDCVVDVEIQNAGNTERVTYRLSARVNKQAYAGTEGTTPGDLLYPSPSALAVKAPAGDLQKEINGVWHMKNVTTEEWHPYWIEGNPPQIVFGPGVVA